MDVSVGSARSLHLWFGMDIRDIVIAFKDATASLVPSSAIKIISVAFGMKCDGSRNISENVKVSMLEEDRSFRVDPFAIQNGWPLTGERERAASFVVKLEHSGNQCTVKGSLDVILMSGIPRNIVMQGGCFDKLLSREQLITCKLKLTDEWGNPFRGIQNIVDVTVAVDPRDWLTGSQGGGAPVPLQNVTDSIVSVDQKGLSVFLNGRYGMRDLITFSCYATDHRIDPPLNTKKIAVSQEFEVEDLALQFHVPSSISDKFKSYLEDGCYVIEVDHGAFEIQRKALFGIYLQLVRNGSSKIFSDHRKEKRVSLQRFKIIPEENYKKSESRVDDMVLDERDDFALELSEGRTILLDKYLCADDSFFYVAKYDELETSMKIIVIAGKPSKIVFESVEAAEVGSPAHIRFTVVDGKGLRVRDLSKYTFKAQAVKESAGLPIKISQPILKKDAVQQFDCMVQGTLPEIVDGQCSLWLTVLLQEKASVSEIAPLEIKERVEVVFRPGPATMLRLGMRSGGVCEPLPERLELRSGTKFEFVVQALDTFGNVDKKCNRRILVTLRSSLDGDKACSATAVLSEGEVDVLLGPWYTRGTSGLLSVALHEKSMPRLKSSEYALQVLPGGWPADISIVTPLQTTADGIVELDDSSEWLQGLLVEVLRASGSNYPDRLEVSLETDDGRLFPEFQAGRYFFDQVAVPKEEGEYPMELVASGAAVPIPSKTLRVKRTMGAVWFHYFFASAAI